MTSHKFARAALVYTVMLLSSFLVGCGMAGDYEENSDPVDEEFVALEYVDNELTSRGYDTEFDYFKMLENLDTNELVSHIYALRAYNPGTTDEQLWDFESFHDQIRQLRDSRIGTLPDICLAEDLSKTNLDSMIDEFCNN